jgi:hypothetical protein
MDKKTVHKLAENEVIFREANFSVAEFISEGEGEDTKTVIPFYCECSNRNCRKRIRLTPKQYQSFHQKRRYFIAIDGHEVPDIEKIIQKEDGYNVIEKFGEPPTAEEIDSALGRVKLW